MTTARQSHRQQHPHLTSSTLIIAAIIYTIIFSASYYDTLRVCLCHSCWVFIIVTEWCCWSDCHGWPAPVNRGGNVCASAGLAEGMWTHWQRLEGSHIDAIFSTGSTCTAGGMLSAALGCICNSQFIKPTTVRRKNRHFSCQSCAELWSLII